MQFVKVSLSARAECFDDVSDIIRKMLAADSVALHILGLEMKRSVPPFPDTVLHVTFAVPGTSCAAVIKSFVGIIEKQADAHRVLQTLNFSDEFDRPKYLLIQ